jgi:signal transduction histidine kinase
MPVSGSGGTVDGAFMGDPLRIRQILFNLVGNTIKFTEKGYVVMRVRPGEGLGQCRFAIDDTGIGIPANRLGEIFEPFTQVDASMTRRFGGTGLGTAISRELVELMGGAIWAESEVGKGSSFQFTLNLTPTDQAPEESDLFVVPGKPMLPAPRHGFKIEEEIPEIKKTYRDQEGNMLGNDE